MTGVEEIDPKPPRKADRSRAAIAEASDPADGGCTCHYCRYLSDPDRDAELESIPDACRAMGGVSHMFVVRRIADPRFKFPEIIRLGRRVFLRKRDRELWMHSPHARLTTAFNPPGEAA